MTKARYYFAISNSKSRIGVDSFLKGFLEERIALSGGYSHWLPNRIKNSKRSPTVTEPSPV